MSAHSLSVPCAFPRETGRARLLKAVGLPLVLASYFALALAYSRTTPMLEGPDESGHLSYINHLVEHRQLPLLTSPIRGDAAERFQPPLYYAVMAGLLAVLHDGPVALSMEKDPSFFEDGGNHITKFLPQPNVVRLSEANAFHLLRTVQILFGLLTLYFAYRTAALALDAQAALAATVAAAGLPQFLFISSLLNNDNLANCLSAAALFLLLRTWLEGSPGLGRAAAIGLLVGAALLTKLTTMFLLPLAAVVLVAAPQPRWRRWTMPAVTLAVAAAVAGWFLPMMFAACGSACRPGTPGRGVELVHNWDFWKLAVGSFSGYFGWLAIPLDRAAGIGLTLMWAAGIASAIWAIARHRAPRLTLWIAAATALAVAQFLFFACAYGLGQGRYLFVALSALATLWGLGLGPLFRRAGYLIPVLGLALLSSNAYVLIRLLPRLAVQG